MKKLLILLIVFLLPLQIKAGSSSLIQSVSNSNSSGNSETLVYPNNNQLGNLLTMCSVNNGAGPTISSVTDTQSNTWALAKAQTFNFSTKDLELWYAPNAKAGANTITVNYSGTVGSVVVAEEYNQVLNTSPLDKTTSAAGGNGAGGTALDSGSTVTTTRPDELLVGCGGKAPNINETFTAGTNYTLSNQVQLGTDIYVGVESQNVSITGTYNATLTASNTNGDWGALIATFKSFVPAYPRLTIMSGVRILMGLFRIQ